MVVVLIRKKRSSMDSDISSDKRNKDGILGTEDLYLIKGRLLQLERGKKQAIIASANGNNGNDSGSK